MPIKLGWFEEREYGGRKCYRVYSVIREPEEVTMTQEDSSNPLPVGLHFFWYEEATPEELAEQWAQLCASTHRLVFIREELEVVNEIGDIDQALDRLAYHMENYLVRIYELRERAAKLLRLFANYNGDARELKARRIRIQAVNGMLHLNQNIKDQYLALVSILDDDIDLRNLNTHETFLSLGYSTGYDVYDPHDALIDLRRDESAHEHFQEKLREEIGRTVEHYVAKIGRIQEYAMELLREMDFVRK